MATNHLDESGVPYLDGSRSVVGGFAVRLASEPRFQVTVDGTIIEVLDGVKYQVRAKDLQMLLREKVVEIPIVSKSVLDERSKSDTFAKAITVVQVLWFLVEMIGRIASSLPLTPLEISTLAFISCAAATEFFWWNKPLDLRSVTVIPIAEEKTRDFLRVYDDIDFSLPEQELAERVEPKKFFERFVGSKEMRVLGIHLVWICCNPLLDCFLCDSRSMLLAVLCLFWPYMGPRGPPLARHPSQPVATLQQVMSPDSAYSAIPLWGRFPRSTMSALYTFSPRIRLYRLTNMESELIGGIIEEFGSQPVISGSISVRIQGRNMGSQAYDDHFSPRICLPIDLLIWSRNSLEALWRN